MSANAPPLTLAERMAEALKDCECLNDKWARHEAYLRTEIELDGVEDIYDASDAEALSTELARRLGGANDPA
jgi:hypothetical protein